MRDARCEMRIAMMRTRSYLLVCENSKSTSLVNHELTRRKERPCNRKALVSSRVDVLAASLSEVEKNLNFTRVF